MRATGLELEAGCLNFRTRCSLNARSPAKSSLAATRCSGLPIMGNPAAGREVRKGAEETGVRLPAATSRPTGEAR